MEARAGQSDETPPRSRKRRGCACAAAGLLTVAAITLASFLTLRGVHYEAMAFRCYPNLVQLQLSMCMYAADHADHYPLANNWCNATLPYTKNRQVYTCPALGEGRGGYALNASLAGIAIRDVDEPYETVSLFDGPPGCNMAGGREAVVSRHPSFLGGHHWEVAFADGHVTGSSDVNAHRWAP